MCLRTVEGMNIYYTDIESKSVPIINNLDCTWLRWRLWSHSRYLYVNVLCVFFLTVDPSLKKIYTIQNIFFAEWIEMNTILNVFFPVSNTYISLSNCTVLVPLKTSMKHNSSLKPSNVSLHFVIKTVNMFYREIILVIREFIWRK